MDITVYLPDALGARAKSEQGLNLSRLLRDAVESELNRRDTVTTTLKAAAEHELELENSDGDAYVGTFSGSVLGNGETNAGTTAFLTDDERILIYDADKLAVHQLDDPEADLANWFDGDELIAVMSDLGLQARVQL